MQYFCVLLGLATTRQGVVRRNDVASLEAEFWSSLDERERKIEIANTQGLECLRVGHLEEALRHLDQVQELSNGSRYLWQRGVALFYLGRLEDAAADLEANANLYERRFEEAATEERVLATCAKRFAGNDDDDDDKMMLTEDIVKEHRPVLRVVRSLFRGEATPDEFRRLTEERGDPFRRLLFSHFYCGLYWELKRDIDRARAHMVLADRRASQEGGSSDLFLGMPRLHLRSRGWDKDPPPDPHHLERAASFE